MNDKARAPWPALEGDGTHVNEAPRDVMNQTAAEPTGRRPHVTILVPAKDEAAGIADTLEALPLATLHTAGYTVDVVVLDGQSRDDTAAIARSCGASVLTDRGQGKGNALRDARPHIRGDFVVMLDADGTYAPDAIPSVVDRLARQEADIVMGDRRALAGSMTAVHRFGNTALSLGATLLYGRLCPDVCTGLWGFTRAALHALPLRSTGFELEAEMFALSSRLGLRVGHVPVDYLPRLGPTKLSATRDGMRIGWCLVRSRFSGLDSLPRVVAAPRFAAQQRNMELQQ